MKSISLYSWNVNGIRAIEKKNFIPWLTKQQPTILGIQETKAHVDQLPQSLKNIPSYETYWNSGARKGYSGVALFTKIHPKKIMTTFGSKILNDEGRVVAADYGSFILFNVYFPNGGQGEHRLKYKMSFYGAFSKLASSLLKAGKKVVVCGDVNTAHAPIDLARPKENETTTGFLPEERAWIDSFIDLGFIDTFRHFHNTEQRYTYWDYKSRARERNVGWRIDYFFVSDNLKKNVKSAFIDDTIIGSDHCPLGIRLTF